MWYAFVAGCQVARLPSGARSQEMPFLTLSARIVGASNALKTKLVAVNDEEVLLCALTRVHHTRPRTPAPGRPEAEEAEGKGGADHL